MHPYLAPLPQILLQTLGRADQSEALAKALQTPLNPHFDLRQHSGTDYHARPAPGLDLLLEQATTDAAEAPCSWGLHRFTLDAASWTGQWPQGLSPRTSTAAEVAKIFAIDTDSALITPTMVCCVVPGLADDQQWCVMCTFDSGSKTLQSFSLVRVGEWITGADATAAGVATSPAA